jgi:hypothetical protein
MVDQIQSLGSLSGFDRIQKAQPLTDDQKAQITSILSQYDSTNLTADDAKAIVKKFREAGIKPGPGMKETIESAGFDAEKLLSLGRPDQKDKTASSTSTGTINVEALQSLQSILNQYDMTNLSQSDQKNLVSQLQEQGLLNPGYIIDLKS